MWMMRMVNLWKKLNWYAYRKIRVTDEATGTRLSERSREFIPETR